MTSETSPSPASAAPPRRLGAPLPDDLRDAGERIPADELAPLQLTRLQWTLRHAYQNVELFCPR